MQSLLWYLTVPTTCFVCFVLQETKRRLKPSSLVNDLRAHTNQMRVVVYSSVARQILPEGVIVTCCTMLCVCEKGNYFSWEICIRLCIRRPCLLSDGFPSLKASEDGLRQAHCLIILFRWCQRHQVLFSTFCRWSLCKEDLQVYLIPESLPNKLHRQEANTSLLLRVWLLPQVGEHCSSQRLSARWQTKQW